LGEFLKVTATTPFGLTARSKKSLSLPKSDGTRSIDETFAIKVVDGSQFLLSEITNADISVRENFDITLPLYTLTNELSYYLESAFINAHRLISDANGFFIWGR
jgi:hypothetical protein